MISALGAAIIAEVFPQAERGRAFGIIGAVVSLGIALGPTVGGVLIGLANWRMIFLVNVPIGIFASYVVWRNVPLSRYRSGRQPFDWWGLGLISVALTCFALGMTRGQDQGFFESSTLVLLAIAVLGLALFLWLEAQIANPILDLKLFQNLQFSLSLLTGILVFIVIAGAIFIIPFYLELGLQYSTQHTGLLLAVSPVLGGIVAPISGNLSDRFGTRIISLLGLVLMAIGCLCISTFTTQITDMDYILRVAPFGIGLGMFQSPNNSAILGSVPPERLGIAAGLLSLTRTLGQTTGVPLLGAIFAGLTLMNGATDGIAQASPESLVAGVQGTFQLAAAILAIAAAIVFGLWQSQLRN